MTQKEAILELLSLRNFAAMETVIKRATNDYFDFIATIASDIYDSCIQDYYAGYNPKVYTRHNNPAGFNLYSANDVQDTTNDLILNFDADNLLPYGGTNGWEKREEVLDAVMNGIRGTKVRNFGRTHWPKSWDTSYPNRYSRFGGVWKSSATTIDGIFQEFTANITKDTMHIFWDYVVKNI